MSLINLSFVFQDSSLLQEETLRLTRETLSTQPDLFQTIDTHAGVPMTIFNYVKNSEILDLLLESVSEGNSHLSKTLFYVCAGADGDFNMDLIMKFMALGASVTTFFSYQETEMTVIDLILQDSWPPILIMFESGLLTDDILSVEFKRKICVLFFGGLTNLYVENRYIPIRNGILDRYIPLLTEADYPLLVEDLHSSNQELFDFLLDKKAHFPFSMFADERRLPLFKKLLEMKLLEIPDTIELSDVETAKAPVYAVCQKFGFADRVTTVAPILSNQDFDQLLELGYDFHEDPIVVVFIFSGIGNPEMVEKLKSQGIQFDLLTPEVQNVIRENVEELYQENYWESEEEKEFYNTLVQ